MISYVALKFSNDLSAHLCPLWGTNGIAGENRGAYPSDSRNASAARVISRMGVVSVMPTRK